VKADGFLVMAHGSADEVARARSILDTANPSHVGVHAGVKAAEQANEKMLHSDPRYPGWVQGWGVVEGESPDWKLAGVFETLQEGRAAAAEAGPSYEVRWGSYDNSSKEFVSGDSC
jgi:hypothetical protein